ncbi:MAG: cyclase [Chloroflexi bacterium]|nr:cyclase [Chloroflexota bacterium]
MAHVLVRQKVESYPKWRPVFDEHDAMRVAAGQIGTPQVFRSGDDPWEVLVLIEWDELERARQFVASPDLKAAMEEAGVTDIPTITFLSQV